MPAPLGVGHAGQTLWPEPRPDGKIVATGAADAVRLWDTSNPGRVRPVGAITDMTSISQLRFTPNGKILAVTGGNKGLRLYDVADPAHPEPISPLIPLGTRYSSMLRISPD